LDGALVSRLDISGSVAGKRAAIQASDNALIDQIDILRGARIDGDIRSDYRQVNEQGRLRLTHLILGRAAGADGLATDAADPDFRFDYRHNITGDNLALRIAGGEAAMHGQHRVHDVRIDPGAALSGQSSYHITGPDQALVNHGRLSPGAGLGDIRVAGDYRQGPGGTLEIEFDGQGGHDRLIVDGTATLRGELALHARPDWYASGWRLDLGETLQAGYTQDGFERIAVALDSPTLRANLEAADPSGAQQAALGAAERPSGTQIPGVAAPLTSPATGTGTGAPTATLRISRVDDAYSRHGATAAAASAGAALDRGVVSAPVEQHRLYQMLDFSATDGSGIAALTTQLAPTPYVAMAASQIDALRVVGDSLSRQQTLAADNGYGHGWRGFALPFASHAGRELEDGSRFDHHSQGLLLGTEQRVGDSAWTVGVHAAFSEQRMTLRSPLQGQGRNSTWLAGLHARYAPDSRQGLFLQGQLRLASVHARLDRDIDAAGYRASHSARWRSNGWQAQAAAGYLWAWSDTFGSGPVAALDYLWLRQPGFQETGDPATRLSVHSAHPQSLRASLGWQLRWASLTSEVGSAATSPQAYGSGRWQAHLQFTRDQELLRHRIGQSATFAVQPGFGMDANQAIAGSGAWRLQIGVSHQTSRLQLAASFDAQLASRGQHQVAGQLSASWRF
ncbi:MAG: autotransporter domain-containing protein, partial [Pigmentiphaga sp.]